MNPIGTEYRAHRRAATHARLQEQRQQPLPAWLATRTARRALALLPAATFASGVLAATVGDFDLGLVACATAPVSYALTVLRRATRMLGDAQENLLDEREISDRDHAYRRGFRLTLSLLGVLAVLAVLDNLLAQEAGVQLLKTSGWPVLVVATSLTATMLPAAALAWSWREPVLESHEFDQ
ncbi:hypothetical protein GTR02_06925 [Kineococcus sp. R8]|uniref:hypothetical protein n=1 Tax=Kineococcus siccus TaxID=2696567 RepID=UPI00141282E7|nr:hypothetical protein [Kineococcus siccus]NAZ81548.1 hypothetical protein [Kineococcus siccus]